MTRVCVLKIEHRKRALTRGQRSPRASLKLKGEVACRAPINADRRLDPVAPGAVEGDHSGRAVNRDIIAAGRSLRVPSDIGSRRDRLRAGLGELDPRARGFSNC